MKRTTINGIAILLALTLGLFATPAIAEEPSTRNDGQAEAATSDRGTTLAIEADAISFFISGYSVIANLSLSNGFQVALGSGRYDVPDFLLEGEDDYDLAQWTATSTSVQVLRMGYRFRGPMKSGPAVAAILLYQNWELRSEPLGGET